MAIERFNPYPNIGLTVSQDELDRINREANQGGASQQVKQSDVTRDAPTAENNSNWMLWTGGGMILYKLFFKKKKRGK